MTAPVAGSSWDSGWRWVNGELVYTRKSRWVSVAHQDRGGPWWEARPGENRSGGALLAEVREEFRTAQRPQRRPRWTDLRAEIADEFAQFTTREDELTAVIDRRCSKLARQVAGRARAGRCPQKWRVLPCWVCGVTIKTRASHRSYCSRKCKRAHYRARGGADVERAYMRQWRERKSRVASWAAADRARSRKSREASERKQRRQELEQRATSQCPECNVSFVALMAKRIYCTDRCKVRAAKRRYWRAHQPRLNELRNQRRAAARLVQWRAA